MSNLTSASNEASASTGNRAENYPQHYFNPSSESSQPAKRKRNLPGNPDPEAEVISLSPKSLMATNRFVCEICNKGFQRDQNLQLHRRGHNLPWKLKQRTNKEVRKKVYVCPETSCVHHDPSRALGDLTGIKKHYCRKHGEKKWKCEKCSKRYAVQSDWKAHSKICGTREYRCDCGTLFSRRDSFITHRAFCDALAEESARSITANQAVLLSTQQAGSSSSPHVNMHHLSQFNNPHAFTLKKEQPSFTLKPADIPPWLACHQPVLGAAGPGPPPSQQHRHAPIDLSSISSVFSTSIDKDFPHQDLTLNQNPNPTQSQTALPFYHASSSPHMSATALLQKAAQMGASMSNGNSNSKEAGPSSPAVNVNVRPHQQNQSFAPHVSTESSVNNNTTGFGLNLSSHENMSSGYSVQCLSSFGNKAAIPAAAGSGAAGGCSVSQSSNAFLQDMMTSLSSSTGFEGTSFEDAFGGHVFSSKKDGHFQESLSNATTKSSYVSTTTAGNESLTKDFLGLRPLSHNDIFNFAGLGGNLNTSQRDQQHQSQHQKPWEDHPRTRTSMDSVLQNLGNKATNTTTGSSNNPPEQQQQNHQQKNRKSSPTDLLSDAKVVAEAAQSALKHDTSKIEKERVARAAENILDSAQQYGKLDEMGMGKYVDKAEEYLHKYNNSSGHGGAGSAAAHEGQAPHSGEKKEGHSESVGGSGGGFGDYAKMAQGFLKK